MADERAADGGEVGDEDGDVGGRAEEDEGDEHEDTADNGHEPGREDVVSEIAIQGSRHHGGEGQDDKRDGDLLYREAERV